MKGTRSALKVVLSLFAVLISIGSLCVFSFAADKTASYENKYGQIVPTDSKLEAQKSSYTFYGDKGTLYFMRISKGKSNANYAVEIYADKSYKTLIRSMSDEFGSAGNKPVAVEWNFKNTASGTYYGKCYTYISREDGIVIDTDSVSTFKIKIDRLTKKTLKLTDISATDTGIKLKWNPLATAKTYKVYRKAEGDKKWTTIATLSSSATSYIDKTAKSGKKYTYTAKAIDGDYKSLHDTKGLSMTYLSSPSDLKADGTGSNGYAKVSWKAVSGAKGYYVYRKGGTLNNSEWKKIATVNSGKTVSYTDKTATSTSWNYTYTVRAYNGSSRSYYDKNGVDFNYIKMPTLKSVSSYTDGMKIEWTCSDKNVNKYAVYVKNGSSWKKLGTTTSKSFVDKTAKSGKSYTYTVKAYTKNNGGAYNNNGMKNTYLTLPKLGKVTFDAKDRAKLTWSKVSGATGYRIYRKIDSDTSWTCLGTFSGANTVSYLDTVKKVSGSTYKYTVKAVNGKVVSYHNTKGISNMFLSVPSFSVANEPTEENIAAIRIKWKAVKGAKTYNVYRRDLGASDWTALERGSTELSYYDTTAEAGKTYEYTVKALNGAAASRYTVKKAIPLTTPVLESAALTADGISLSWGSVTGADTYYIYRKTVDGEWTAIGSYSLNSYIDTSEEAKTEPFVYTVVAEKDGFRSKYDTTGIASFAEAKSFTATFNAATETEPAFIKASWEFDGVAESVELFKSTAGEEPVSIGVFTPDNGISEYIDKDISVGTEYTYTAKAVKEGKVPTVKVASAKYPYAPLEAVDFDVKSIYDDGDFCVEINFKPVENAEYYRVYRRLSPDAGWKKIAEIKDVDATTESVTYTDNDVDTEIRYYYTVRAYASDRDSTYNKEGKHTTIFLPLDIVTDIIVKEGTVQAEDGTTKTVAVITWNAVKNVDLYTILRKTSDGTWENADFVWSGDTLTFTDDTIEQGVNYVYTVKASSVERGESINQSGAEFCWEFDVPPTTAPDDTQAPETPDNSGDSENGDNTQTPEFPETPDNNGASGNTDGAETPTPPTEDVTE